MIFSGVQTVFAGRTEAQCGGDSTMDNTMFHVGERVCSRRRPELTGTVVSIRRTESGRLIWPPYIVRWNDLTATDDVFCMLEDDASLMACDLVTKMLDEVRWERSNKP